jgi:mycothiol system anti-sigma-R factor
MDCSEVTDRLWEYLDGELAAKEAVAVDRHLTTCPFCHPHYCFDRMFLVLVVRSLGRPCPAPAKLRIAIRARLADARLDR